MREPSRRASVVILVLAAVACFGVVGTYGFTNAEDEALIARNPTFNPPTPASLRAIWTTPHLYLYIPATYTAWWLIAQVAQTGADASGATLNPWVFHSANLLVHVAAALLVLQLLRRLTRRNGAALAGALLFAVHPIQTEAVAWTTGMKDTLCGALSFAALLGYVVTVDRRSNGQGLGVSPERSGGASETALLGRDARATRRHGGRYALATLFLVLAMLAKPAAVVVPVMALVIDRWILHRRWGDIARALALWFVLIIPVMFVARAVQPAAEVAPAPLWARPLVAADALAFYLGKLVLPVGLSNNYGRSPEVILRSGAIYYTWLAPALLAAVVLWRRRDHWLVAAALLFVAGVLPVLGLTTFLYQIHSTVADRFLYLSMLGAALAAAWLMSRRWSRATVAVAAVLLIVLGVRSASQARVWRNRLTLSAHAVAVQPDNPAARSSYAGALIRENRIDEAIVQLEHVMRIMPNDYTAELLARLREEEMKRQGDKAPRRAGEGR